MISSCLGVRKDSNYQNFLLECRNDQILCEQRPFIYKKGAWSGKDGHKQKRKVKEVIGRSDETKLEELEDELTCQLMVEILMSQLKYMYAEYLREMSDELMGLHSMYREQVTEKLLATDRLVAYVEEVVHGLEGTLDSVLKTRNDALWALFQEQNEGMQQQLLDADAELKRMSNFLKKDLPLILKEVIEQEVAALVAALEEKIPLLIFDGTKREHTITWSALNQLAREIYSKLEPIISMQIQAHIQTSIQDTVKSGIEATVAPAFEMSCKAMFGQVEATFQKGMDEHTTAAWEHYESANLPLVNALKEAISTASSVTQTPSGELADGQSKILALAANLGNLSAVDPLVTQQTSGPLGALYEKVSGLVTEGKYDEAFRHVLASENVGTISWFCAQVDLRAVLLLQPLPLTQAVLLSLLCYLSLGISDDTPHKVSWMTDIAIAIIPSDRMIAGHVSGVFQRLHQTLCNHEHMSPAMLPATRAKLRRLILVIESMKASCS